MYLRGVELEDSLQSDSGARKQIVKGERRKQRHLWSLTKRLLSLAGEDNVKRKPKRVVDLQNL